MSMVSAAAALVLCFCSSLALGEGAAQSQRERAGGGKQGTQKQLHTREGAELARENKGPRGGQSVVHSSANEHSSWGSSCGKREGKGEGEK